MESIYDKLLNKKQQVMKYIIDNAILTSNGYAFKNSLQHIVRSTGVSLSTVSNTVSFMKEQNMIEIYDKIIFLNENIFKDFRNNNLIDKVLSGDNNIHISDREFLCSYYDYKNEVIEKESLLVLKNEIDESIQDELFNDEEAVIMSTKLYHKLLNSLAVESNRRQKAEAMIIKLKDKKRFSEYSIYY